MLKIKNPFKKRTGKKSSEKIISIGELAWKSINLENEPKINPNVEVV